MIGLFFTTLTGCQKSELKNKLEISMADDLISDKDVLPGEANYYYTFTGVSKNLSFKTGIADYRDDKAIFELKDIELVNKNYDYVSGELSVYFNDKFWGSMKFKKSEVQNGIIKDYLGVYGEKIKRDADGNFYGEFDSFLETEPANFKDALKVKVCFCKNKSCTKQTVEELKLDIIKHN